MSFSFFFVREVIENLIAKIQPEELFTHLCVVFNIILFKVNIADNMQVINVINALQQLRVSSRYIELLCLIIISHHFDLCRLAI